MTTAPVYLLTIPGNSTIQISQDELRSLLNQIETQLHHSKVYRRALATLQNLLGSSADQAKVLFKAVSREAIALSFQQFALQQQKATDVNEQANTADVPLVVEPENGDLSSGLNAVKLDTNISEVNSSEGNLPSQPEVVANTADDSVKATEDNASSRTPMRWLKRTKKPSKAEIAKQIAAEQRLESLRKISQELRQARESQGLSLSQLNVYTHVAIHQMQALENGNFESLPEDVYLRGFIRVMGNALGLNGTNLAACLPVAETPKVVLPMSYKPKSSSPGLGLDIRPVHLYVGYTALVAGAVGGLSVISQQANADRALIPDEFKPSSPSVSQSSQRMESTARPGLRSSSAGVSVGPDIAPPEAL